ncbi:hypothetical protein D3C75_1043240 [compost metagenome]
MVEIIILLAVGFVIAGVQQRIDGRFFAVHRNRPADPVIIAVEDNRISVPPQQDQGVGALLKPVANPGLQRFVGL